MNAHTQRREVAGPAGSIECAIDAPCAPATAPRGVAVVCHPHPQHGGTMDNKVVRTLVRALTQLGYTAVRFNFRGVGKSQGAWAQGPGEIDDALAVVTALRAPGQPLVLAGFSFGAYVASHAAARLAAPRAEATGNHAPSHEASNADALRGVERLVLVGPAASRFDMAAVPADTLVIHGEADDVVPLAAVFDWARPQALPVTVIPGAGHFFHGQLPLLKSLVVDAWRG